MGLGTRGIGQRLMACFRMTHTSANGTNGLPKPINIKRQNMKKMIMAMVMALYSLGISAQTENGFKEIVNPAKRNVLDLKNETCKNREKRNVLKISHTRHFKTTKKQSKTGCFYSF